LGGKKLRQHQQKEKSAHGLGKKKNQKCVKGKAKKNTGNNAPRGGESKKSAGEGWGGGGGGVHNGTPGTKKLPGVWQGRGGRTGCGPHQKPVWGDKGVPRQKTNGNLCGRRKKKRTKQNPGLFGSGKKGGTKGKTPKGGEPVV